MNRVQYIFIIIFSLFLSVSETNGQRGHANLGVSKKYILSKINKLRSKGCQCGRKYYSSVAPVTWNNKLEKTALSHAKEMSRYNFFSHRSRKGEDVGERFDNFGYKWQYAGENLAEGQESFDEAFQDWIDSPTHCKMLMNPDMNEMAISKYGKYWVQHFGRQMPPRTKRKNVRYSEG